MNVLASWKKIIKFIVLFVCDVSIILFICYLSIIIRKDFLPLFLTFPQFEFSFKKYSWIFGLWVLVLIYKRAYTQRFGFWDEVKMLWQTSSITIILTLILIFINKQGVMYSRTLLFLMYFLSLFVFPPLRTRIKSFLFKIGFRERLLILGSGYSAILANELIKKEPNLGYEVAIFLDDVPNKKSIDGKMVYNEFDKIIDYLETYKIKDVLIAKPEYDKRKLTKLTNKIQHKISNLMFLPDVRGIAVASTQIRYFFREETFLIEVKNNLTQPFNIFIKRTVDYVLGVIFFLLSILPMLIISTIIKFSSKGPVIYKQKRIGKDGRPFLCYKFRTMYEDSEQRLKVVLERDPEAKLEWDTYRKLKKDPRITPIGKFLRRTSLDELPQIFNVLKGDMSLIGPRPVTQEEIDKYYHDCKNLCLCVLPGITGLWQVTGRNTLSYSQRVALDCWYVRNWSLWLDIVILLKTPRAIFREEGAY